jgi:creatinine amidohydrolase
MRVADMDWRMVEDWTRHDDRGVLPIGSVEQHAGLSLATDAILAERVAIEAAEPLGVPVFPVLPFGLTPGFTAFPGTVTLRVETFAALLRDVLESFKRSGFRRVLIVNGHGGNAPADSIAAEWMMDNPDCRVRVHHWYRGPAVTETVAAVDPVAGHGSWVENFPWTRLKTTQGDQIKEPVEVARLQGLPPFERRTLLEDGNYGGRTQHDDGHMRRVWEAGVLETRALLEGGW